MRQKMSIIVLNDAGKQIKQFNAPVALLLLLAMLSTSGATLLGVIFYDYHGLRKSINGIGPMARQVVEQRDEIAQQRLQIQSFANEINDLKIQLIRLNHFEEKIRVIANLDSVNGEENLFGVGGAAPEDLDAQLELGERHEDLIREMHQQINELDTASRRQTTSFGALMDKLDSQRNLLASTPAIRPASGWITSPFGHRTSPFTGHKEFHRGLDIANRKGTNILATADGVVSFVGKKSHMGTVLVIDHGHGMVTRYAHLSDTLKKRGEIVNRGDTIARMGNSGRSTGPHLHYEVHLNGVPVNPDTYILN